MRFNDTATTSFSQLVLLGTRNFDDQLFNKVFLTVRCAGGEPQASFIQQADDHGGRGGKTGG